MTKEEIGATLCDNCEKVIYEFADGTSEFNSSNDHDIICDECKKEEA